jgi:hypothetical protein
MKWPFLILLALLWPRPALAGPPYQLDDPDPIPVHHFEFYTFGAVSSTPGVVNAGVPALELNWSGVPNVMFHFVVSSAEAMPSQGPNTVGLGDTEAGLQYRFVDESAHRPMIGTFTMLEIPTGNADRGLGAGGFSIKLPIWMQKSVGGWTLNWGAGESLTRVTGSSDYPFGGALVQHDVTKRLTLGSEIFYHGAQDPSSAYAVMLDVGGSYGFSNPDHQLLFCYGHSVSGQAENYGYLALYWTWGPKSPRS